MTGRIRRTRIYGANYNIGESYYKPTLDSLDHKRDSRTQSILRETPKPILTNIDTYLDEPKTMFPSSGLQEARSSLFDYTGKELSSHITSDINDDFDEDIRHSVRKIRQLKDLKETSPSFLVENTGLRERSSKSRFDSKYLQNLKAEQDLDDFTSGLSGMSMATSDVYKSTTSSARANATKERLASIEWEMSERSEKQVQREKRSADLKKILNEAGESSKVVKKVTF